MTVEIPEPVASFWAAVNRHDEAAFLDAFTDDGVVDDWGRPFEGRDRIKQWSDKEFIGSRGVLSPEQVDVEGFTVVVVGDWRSSWANGRSRFEFLVAGEKIEKMTISEG